MKRLFLFAGLLSVLLFQTGCICPRLIVGLAGLLLGNGQQPAAQ
jgi:hypothetical protein